MESRLQGRDFLSIADLDADTCRAVLAQAARQKAGEDPGRPLQGQTIAMVFLRPSNRTRVSFEVAIHRLGGHPVALFGPEIEMGRRESVADVARILDRFVQGLVARIPSHRDLLGLAQHMRAPVVNAMTDAGHPCQVLADCLTLAEVTGRIQGAHVAFIGDGNNVCASWIEAAGLLGIRLTVVTPPGYEPEPQLLARAAPPGRAQPAAVRCTSDCAEALRDADVVYTDVWTSMGQEAEHEQRREDFAAYQVNQGLLQLAPAQARVMHCLPAHRGEEITDEVIEGPASAVWQQAENRLHAQKALIELLIR
ncbi:MAG: ornithine carbamoyltransferase [Solirubrobacteraceae bacterium]